MTSDTSNFKYLILYDDECLMCNNLAIFASRRSENKLRFEAWQEFVKAPPEDFPKDLLSQPADQLRVWTGSEVYEGKLAWEFLLETFPDLRGVSWMAEKLGLHKQTARVIQAMGKGLKLACFRCPNRSRRPPN
jgi:hypothetical protein